MDLGALTPAEIALVEEWINNPEFEAEVERRYRELDAEFKPLFDGIREAEHLTEADFAIRMNCRE